MGIYDATPARRGTVVDLDGLGRLLVAFNDWPGPPQPIQRPFIGGTSTGLHSVPQVGPAGDQVAVHHEVAGHPLHASSVADASATLPSLGAAETAIYGARGEILSYATASGPTVLYRNAGNTLSIQVDPSTNRVNITATGGLYVNGVQVTVP